MRDNILFLNPKVLGAETGITDLSELFGVTRSAVGSPPRHASRLKCLAPPRRHVIQRAEATAAHNDHDGLELLEELGLPVERR